MRAREIQAGSGSEDEPTQPIQNPGLQELHSKVALNNGQLLELVSNDQKFMQRVMQYNAAGAELAGNEDFEKGLVYLQEAQRILQYAASCGKTIDRFLIIATLHNEACLYQKLWELEKSCDYMEAIIYNMSSSVDQGTPFAFTSQFHNPSSEGYQNLSAYVYRRLTTAVYHLQFSAVSSQVGKHGVAIESAKSSLKMLSEVLTQECSYENFITGKKNDNTKMKQLLSRSKGINLSIVKTLVADNRRLLKNLRNAQTTEDGTAAKLKKFSIGEVMQIDPITCDKANQIVPIDSLISSLGFIQTALYVSIAYYAIATEMRLIYHNHSDPFVRNQEIERSKIYHLNAIRIAIEFVPYVTDYLEHITKSLKNNYQIDLNADGSQTQDPTLDPNLVLNTSFIMAMDTEPTQKELDSSYKTETKKIPNEVFGQTFTIHKKMSDFGSTQSIGKQPKKSKSKVHSISITVKQREKHSASKDLKLSKNLKTGTIRKEEEAGPSRKVSHKNILHKPHIKRDKQRLKTGNSQEKTKDQTKKDPETKNKAQEKHKLQPKVRPKKKINDEYMGNTATSKDKRKKNGIVHPTGIQEGKLRVEIQWVLEVGLTWSFCLVIFGVVLAAIMGIITAVFMWLQISMYGTVLGITSLGVEAMLAFPQLLHNQRNRSVEGLSIVMIMMWFFGDFFKTIYFILENQPFQFILSGAIQLTVDTLILVQIMAFKEGVRTYQNVKEEYQIEVQEKSIAEGI